VGVEGVGVGSCAPKKRKEVTERNRQLAVIRIRRLLAWNVF
jgi:hypothetical protein